MAENGQVTKEDVIRALSTVQEPELGGDLVSRNMVRDVAVCDGMVAFEVVLTTPACPLKGQIENECRQALMKLPGVKQVTVRMGSNVARRAQMGEDLLPEVRNVIAVASGKGGVGKSTVAVNLAAALAQTGARVGLLDADIYGPSIPVMMGVQRAPFVDPRDRKILPIEQHQLKCMSLGFLMPDNATPVVWRGPMVGSAVRQMLADVKWGELDYLIVDLPPGTGDAQLTLAQTVPLTGVVIVMTSQDVAVNIASKALAMFQKLNVPVLGVVENMSTFVCPHCQHETNIFTRGGGEQAAMKLGVPFLGSIPLDPQVVAHGDAGTPTVVAAAESAQAEAFRKVTGAVAARVSVLHFGADKAADGGHKDPLGGLMSRFRKS
ncbi:MAG: Mrp/NBP35 family ATP-binding protein [Armatimonadetes bacterium]|nr:Mrp/NBP35 family ATP-binding protein [Armatimonadota bacterium]